MKRARAARPRSSRAAPPLDRSRRPALARPPLAGILALLLLASCTVADPVAVRRSADGGAGPTCAGSGPPPLRVAGVPRCGAAALAPAFAYALCTCQAYDRQAALTTDSFDSGSGPYLPGGPPAPVGLNGKLDTQGQVRTGPLRVADPEGVRAGADLQVTGALHSGGPLLAATAAVRVSGDLQVRGEVQAHDLIVGGTLTLPAGAALQVSGTRDIAAEVRAPVTVPAPCPCGDAEIIDVPAMVESLRADNDDDDIALVPTQLAGFGGDTVVTLPCGRYFLTELRGESALTLRVTGRVLLGVAAGLTLSGRFALQLAPGAELDLFVTGPINLSGPAEIGDLAAPARTRLYLAAGGALNVSAGLLLGAGLYAPGMDLALTGPGEIFGAFFLRRALPSQSLLIHHDTRLSRLGGC